MLAFLEVGDIYHVKGGDFIMVVEAVVRHLVTEDKSNLEINLVRLQYSRLRDLC